MKKFFNLKEISYYIQLVFISLALSCSIFSTIKDSIIIPVDGVNTISIAFTYLIKDGDLTLNAYDQNNTIQKEAKRTIEIKKSLQNIDNQEVINFENYQVDIPILSSHKIELELDTDNNFAYIDSIKINNRVISLIDFANNVKSNSKLKIGNFKNGISNGIILGSDDSKVLLDLTDVLHPVKITIEEQEELSNEQTQYTILTGAFIFIAIFLLCYVTSITLRMLATKDPRQKFLLLLLAISIVSLITTSYYVLFKDYLINISNYSALDSESNFLEKHTNLLKFLQNFIPLISVFTFCTFLSFFIKNRFFKTIVVLFTLPIFIVLIVDNCLLNVLSVRLIFNMTGHATETKYFKDFIYSYLISESGILMILGLLFILYTIISSLFITLKAPSVKFFTPFLTVIASLVVWGFYPSQSDSFDFRLLNPFQVNGFCFQKVGNFDSNYSDSYAPRKNLKINFSNDTGLNQKKNVILVLVESWGCNFTYICGTGPSKMPKIESLKDHAMFFDNYYSIMPSTSLALLSMIKSVPVITHTWNYPLVSVNTSDVTLNTDSSSYSKWLYSQNDLIHAFKTNGYHTSFISSTDLVFGMDETIEQTVFDEIIDAQSSFFANSNDRSVFNSVNDDELFSYILNKIKSEDKKFFYVTKTATNHAPFNSPLGYNNLDKAFEYTDNSVFKFVKGLESINYFDNGILILVGDHHAWGNDGAIVNNDEPTYINKVPLIIIDGKSQNEVNHKQFSHASLGILLQYLELPSYRYNQFNTNPLLSDANSEIIFGYDISAVSYLYVKDKNKNDTIILNGDNSSFKNNNIFTEEEMNKILGYISYFRR